MIIGLIGDSQGRGLKVPLERLLNARGHELTRTSWTEDGAGIDRASPHAAALGVVDVAIVVLGGNDGNLAERDPERYRTKLDSLAQQLRTGGAREVVWVGPMHATDQRVAGLHDAARAVQGRSIRGARWVDGYLLSSWAQHAPDGVHFTRNGYVAIAGELDRAVFRAGAATAIGLIGTLTFLGAVGVIGAEALASRA